MKIKETLKRLLGLERKIPLLIAGYDIRRWERRGGGDIYVEEFIKKLLFLDGFAVPYVERVEIDEEKKTKTIIWNSIPCGPTHLQYHSPFGFLLTWPFCFHVWIQIRPKQYTDDGRQIPGSEKVWYFRCGLARWDAGADTYITPTWYGPFNLHWD